MGVSYSKSRKEEATGCGAGSDGAAAGEEPY